MDGLAGAELVSADEDDNEQPRPGRLRDIWGGEQLDFSSLRPPPISGCTSLRKIKLKGVRKGTLFPYVWRDAHGFRLASYEVI